MELPKPPGLPLHRHVSASPFFPPCIPNWKPLTRPSPSSSPELSPLRCCTSSLPSSGEFGVQGGRRSAFLLALFPHRASAGGSILDKYVKKPKESLGGKTLEGDSPEFGLCRSLLHSGPAASLRVNMRAVAQYASESRDGNTAFNDVYWCLRELEELDSLLLHASRKETDLWVSSMKEKVDVAVKALDLLLRTVPDNILDKGKSIADAYRSSAEEEPKILDPEIERPESIL